MVYKCSNKEVQSCSDDIDTKADDEKQTARKITMLKLANICKQMLAK